MKKKYVIYSPTVFYVFCFTVLFFTTPAFTADNPLYLISQDETTIVIEGTADDLSVTPSQYVPYQNISIPGYSVIHRGGSPAVLQTGQLIEIPEGCDIKIAAFSLETEEYHNFLLGPAPYQVVVEDELGNKTVNEQYLPDFDQYAKDAFSPAELATIEFTGYMRDKRIARLLCSPVQYNPVSETLLIHSRYRVLITFDFAASEAIKTPLANTYQGSAIPSTGDEIFENIYKSCLLNTLPTIAETTTSQELSSMVGIESVQTEGSPYAVKATIESEGIYKITYESLAALGINLSGTTIGNIKVENRGNEIPLYRSGTGTFSAGEYILFYGQPFKSLYAKKNVYWIYQGSSNGKTMVMKDGSYFSGYTAKTSFKNTYHGEQDLMYWEAIPNGEGADHWFWNRLQPTSTPSPASITYTAPLQNIVTNAGNYSMKVNVRGETALGHHTKVYVNGTLVKDFTWSGQVERTENILDISPSLFINGNNSIKIEEILDSGVSVDRIYTNWFEINYNDSFVAESNELKFNGEGTGNFSFTVSNFTGSSIMLFDITNPLNTLLISNPEITGGGCASYTMKFGDTLSGSAKYYYAAEESRFKSPLSLVVDTPSSLKTARPNIDYIIITNEAFYNDILPLKNYRTAQGRNVEIAKIQDIYDEFSYGIKDAHAIKDFLTYAYNYWKTGSHPTYVLLVGDANIDYRDDLNLYSSGYTDYVPTYLYQTYQLGDTPTDNWFVCVSGTDPIPDMIIGRFCVKTSADVNNIFAKIQAYEASASGAWSRRVILAADNENVFEVTSNNLAALLPVYVTAQKVYLSSYGNVTQAKNDLVSKINAGSLITNYTGHGSVDNWAGEYLFRTSPPSDIPLLTNGNVLTFVMALNCLNGFFPNFLDEYSLAEEFARAQNKGAIACLASTGLGYTSEHEVLATKILERIFTDGDTGIGTVAYTGKINAYNQILSTDIIETFTLFGDPATPFKIADIDNDGIVDTQDNCPDKCNVQQLDADADGIGDVCDPTPGCGGCGSPQCETQC
jgi:hypothetical protein